LLKKLFLLTLIIIQNLWSADSPQWRGLHRDGIYSEPNLLTSWPKDGPALLWSTDSLGKGYSSPAIANGRVYVTGKVDKNDVLFAFDLDGKPLWKTAFGQAWKSSFPETRTTPTVDGDRLYVVSGMGQIVCLDAKTGMEKWSVHAVEKFKGEYPRWGISDAPLVDGDLVFCTPGGPEASVVALNKSTGETVWTSKELSEKGSYCAPILAQWAGQRMLITQLENSAVALDAGSGKLLWRDQFSDYQKDPKEINPNSPLYHDGAVYLSSGYDNESTLIKLAADGNGFTRAWVDSVLDVHIGGMVLVDGYIYGANWVDNREGRWVCLQWSTGKVMYETDWVCKGSIISANGLLYCYEEKKGTVALVKANPESFDIISTFNVSKGSGPHWAHPVISDGRLYIRHGESLMVYDIRQK
jgi:outer membrane protein assembly factor BamB